MPRLVVCALVLFASTHLAFALPAGWTDDYAAAQRRAKEEGKGLLLDFTGSDWCGWCIKLHEEVFDHDEFRKYAASSWILVYVDFPSEQGTPARDAAQNAKLKEQFKIEGFPTIVLLNADGSELGQTGYRPGGHAKYIPHLEAFKSYPRLKAGYVDALAKAPDDAAKQALALALCRAASEIDKIMEVAAEVDVADPDNTHALHTTLATARAEERLAADDAKAALAVLAAFEKRFPGGPGEGLPAQQFHVTRGMAHEALGDTAQELEAYRKAIKAAPQSDQVPDIKEWIEEKGGKAE